MSERMRRAALLVLVAVASFGPLRNYDLFWHLATGRWIVEHRAFPLSDPFSVASDRHPWINGEWLFELIAYAIHAAGGLTALSLARAALAASTFALAYYFARRDADERVALVVTTIAWAGAMATFDFRPSSVAALFIVLALGVRSPAAYAALSIVWINVHPSALLAPLLAGLATRRALPVVASAAGLLVNPFGWRAIAAPVELLSFVSGGTFVNTEWLPSPPHVFPILYICVAAGVAGFVALRDRTQWWRAVLLAIFGYLAIRHVRHQVLFFAAFPLLVSPVIRVRFREAIAVGASAAMALIIIFGMPHAPGVSPERFPITAAARLRATGLRGHIYNPDQFGGYLIWAFYPERRVLTDGRNELFRTFIPEYAAARVDERRWRRLLARYRIDLAVDEYRDPLDVTNAATGVRRSLPASLAYWPRRHWALIAYDDAAMVFARRAAFTPEELKKWEIDAVPDAR